MNTFAELFEGKVNKKAHLTSTEVLRDLYEYAGKQMPQGYRATPKLFEFATNGGYWFGFKPIGTEGKDGVNQIWMEDKDVEAATGRKIKDLMKLFSDAGAVKSSWKNFLR